MATGEQERVERRLTAILAADVVGYSRLMGADEEGTLAALKAIRRELVDPEDRRTSRPHRQNHWRRASGRVRQRRRRGALRGRVQREMAERNTGVPAETRIEFRIGINLGDIIIDGDDIFGDGVNVAARLETLAEPGGICVSRVVRDQVRDKLAFAFEDMGEQQVKNIARPVRAYRIRIDAAVAAAPAAGAAARPARQALVRGAAVPEHERRSGAGVFRQRDVEEIRTAIARLPWLFVIAIGLTRRSTLSRWRANWACARSSKVRCARAVTGCPLPIS